MTDMPKISLKYSVWTKVRLNTALIAVNKYWINLIVFAPNAETKSNVKESGVCIMLQESETIIFKKAANLFRGLEAVGGWVTLTDQRLIFEPHRINIQTEPLVLTYKEMIGIEKRNTLNLVPNGIKITTESGGEYKFVIWKRTAFIKYVNERIRESQQQYL